MLDATALTPYKCDAASVDALRQGETYLFFLTKSPDPKQKYYFAVSPVQGAVWLNGESVLPAKYNDALLGYTDIPTLVKAIKSTLESS